MDFMDTALILVDLENEWTIKDSDYYAGNLAPLIKNTNALLDFARKSGFKIIFITHIEKDSDSAFNEKSNRVEIISKINKLSSDVLIKKYKISPFYKTSLENELIGIKRVIVSGILTNLCVRSTISDAYDRGFEVVVIKDCCKAFDKKTHNFTISDLKSTREEVEFLNLKEFILKQ
jgi:ureidoacrylate peracid hydrolase